MNGGAPRIEFDGLVKSYGDREVVRGLTLTVEGGSLFCFLGANGAGKTTTIHVLMGLKNPSGGDVRINGTSVRSPSIHGVRRRVGYVPEQPILYEHLTGREMLQFTAELYGVRTDARLEQALERFGLAADADAPIRTYSMGMRKKVAILAALVHDPEILVLDEPTGALDAAGARAVKDIMEEARRAGKLVFFTTHVLEIAEAMADRIAVIHGGTLVADGSLDQLRDRHAARPGETLEALFLRLTAAVPAR